MTADVDCFHEVDGRQVPCPPMCVVQGWPHVRFRWSFLRRRYVLRRRYRDAT